jgi:hypothetical protein
MAVPGPTVNRQVRLARAPGLPETVLAGQWAVGVLVGWAVWACRLLPNALCPPAAARRVPAEHGRQQWRPARDEHAYLAGSWERIPAASAPLGD